MNCQLFSLRLRLMLAAILVTLGGSTAARAGGVVSSCDEPSLRAALAGGGLVTFSCSGAITLAATLQFTANTSIDGSGQNVTISGGGSVRVLLVNSGVTLSLNNLTIANANSAPNQSGGGALNQGTLIVANSTFSGNSATGADGGGIYNDRGTVFIMNSTFSGNIAQGSGSGGAISNRGGALTIVNSTLSGNSAPGATAWGGGIYSVAGGTVFITSSTLSGNSASNGGGIFDGGDAVTLRNTLLANNHGGACALSGGAITDDGYNFDDDGSCGLSSANHSLSNNKNANLGSLSNNGGPAQTVPLLPGSAAIGAIPAGTNGCATTLASDERGVMRPESLNGNCSIGAYEYVPPTNATITNCSSDSQLQAAVALGGRIVFACSGDIPLTRTLTIAANTAIDATGFSVTMDGRGNLAVLSDSAYDLTLNNLTIANGRAGYGGGLYCGGGTLVVTNSTFSNNAASENGGGGGIFSGTTLIVTNSTFSGNSALRGGAIANNGATLTLVNSTFSGNSAPGGLGGALLNTNTSTLAVISSTFSGNSAKTGGGGGIANGGTATLENTVIANNTSEGGCFNDGVIVDSGYNLDDDGSCGFSSANHSLSNNKNANLGSLSNNGGPTQTIPLLSGSAAIDAIPLEANGCGSSLLTDQRGISRPQGFACDIGAYETTQFPVTIATSPSGLSYTVDGVAYTSQQSVELTPGDHTIASTATQAGTTGTRYVWQNWSDGGALSHKISVFAPAGYTANFQTQYQLTTAVNPSGAGMVGPPSGSYYPAGTQVQLAATANSGYVFSSWTGTVASASNPLTVTMNSPVTETANFIPFTFTITANPPSETLGRGETAATFFLTLKSVNGFSGDVTLSCSGGPAGSSCSDFPTTVHLNGTASAISGDLLPNNTKPGTYTVIFTGVSGSLTNTAMAKFTVQ